MSKLYPRRFNLSARQKGSEEGVLCGRCHWIAGEGRKTESIVWPGTDWKARMHLSFGGENKGISCMKILEELFNM